MTANREMVLSFFNHLHVGFTGPPSAPGPAPIALPGATSRLHILPKRLRRSGFLGSFLQACRRTDGPPHPGLHSWRVSFQESGGIPSDRSLRRRSLPIGGLFQDGPTKAAA